MDDADRVRRRQTVENEVDLRGDLVECARAGSRDEVRDRTALGELHRVPGDVAAAVPVEDRNDRRVRELRRESRLAAKTADDAFVARNARMEELERHLAAER